MPRIDLHEPKAEAGKYQAALMTLKNKAPEITKQIFGFLKMTTREFDVFVLNKKNAYGQMLTEGDKSGKGANEAIAYYKEVTKRKNIIRPAVFWCPYYYFEYFADFEGLKEGYLKGSFTVSSWKEAKFVTMKNDEKPQAVAQASRVRLPPEITLLHEIGHVKQYYEKGGLVPWKGIVSDHGKIAELEADNLKRHENLATEEYKLPPRKFYKSSREHLREDYSRWLNEDRKYLLKEKKTGLKIRSFRVTEIKDRQTDDDKLENMKEQKKISNIEYNNYIPREKLVYEADKLIDLSKEYDPIVC